MTRPTRRTLYGHLLALGKTLGGALVVTPSPKKLKPKDKGVAGAGLERLRLERSFTIDSVAYTMGFVKGNLCKINSFVFFNTSRINYLQDY
jgi:hypothetical protein